MLSVSIELFSSEELLPSSLLLSFSDSVSDSVELFSVSSEETGKSSDDVLLTVSEDVSLEAVSEDVF